MNDQEPRVKQMFIEALEVGTPEEREAFLNKACAFDPSLRRKVEALLRAYEQAGSFLKDCGPEELSAPVPEATWERIDPYVQRFEQAWQSGTPPAIDDFLPTEGADRLAALKELVKIDLERRLKTGTPAC